MADSIIHIVVFLDGSVNPTNNLLAWEELIALMFRHVRKGYYAELRLRRMAVKKSESTQDVSTAGLFSISKSFEFEIHFKWADRRQ